jgi:di/tricarboxylate transporter
MSVARPAVSYPAVPGAQETRSAVDTALRWAAGVALGLALWFIRVPQLTPHQQHGAALALATIAWWLLGVAPQGVIALLFIVLVILLRVLPSQALLAQAWTSSQIWFVLASFGFGFMIADTSLGERLTSGLLRYFSRSFWLFGIFIMLAGGLLSLAGMAGDFGRMGILYPMVAVAGASLSAARRASGTKAMAMMILGVGQPTLMYVFNGFWLNQTFLGLDHEHLDYVGWITHFTVPSMVLSALNLLAIRFLFPADIEIPAEVSRQRLADLAPMSAREWRTLGFLGLALILWITSIWTGLDAGWIALGVFALMLLPRIGVMQFGDFAARMNWNIVFFLTGAFALGSLLGKLKLAPVVEHWLVPAHLPHNPYVLGLLVSVWSMLIHLFAGDAASTMAVTVPVFHHAAVIYGLSPLVFGFIAYMSIFTQYFFLYQAAGTLFAYGYGMFSQRDVLKFGVASVATTAIGLGVVSVFYWQITGMLH